MGHRAEVMRIVVAVLAHNEEARIAACLASLPCDDPDIAVHVVVNGSTDRTAEIARSFAGVTVHAFAQGGKSRSWNRFVFDTLADFAAVHVFVDGDAEIVPGSIAALAAALDRDPYANAAAGMPANGRRAAAYRAEMRRDHGMFGDLYAVTGSFLVRMKAAGIRLPEDLIGDDGLIGAMAKTDLHNESHWDNARVLPVEAAGFLCAPTRMSRPSTLRIQYKRMINYSVRHFQNRIISAIMRSEGPAGLPPRLSRLYPEWLPHFTPRRSPALWWFDRQALARMRAAAAADRAAP